MADYVIKQGDTLSAIAKANNTTVESLAKANEIADPNKIIAGATLRLPGADINASEVQSGAPVIETPTQPVEPPTTGNAILDYTKQEQERIAKEREDAQKSMGGDATRAGLIEEAKTRPIIDTESKLTSEMQESGATDLQKQVATQNTLVATIKGEVEKLEIQEQNEIDALEQSGVTRGAIDREKAVIQRKYASQRALKNAELSAEAAVLSAMQGNFTMAKQAAQDAVDAYTYDYQQNVKTFDTLFSLHADWVDELDEAEQNLLKTAASEAQNELDKVTKEKSEVSDLMIEYNAYGAGISLDDTLESAQKKAAKANEAKVELSKTKAEGGMSEDELISTLSGVQDYLDLNKDKSILDAVSTLPTAQRTNVLNAYYLNKAFQEEQGSKPKNDALSVISSGDVSETSIQNAITNGATNDEILSSAGNNQAQATQILGQLSTKGREQALEGAGAATKGAITGFIERGKVNSTTSGQGTIEQIGDFLSPFLRGLTK
jgi:LysM repeat protein